MPTCCVTALEPFVIECSWMLTKLAVEEPVPVDTAQKQSHASTTPHSSAEIKETVGASVHGPVDERPEHRGDICAPTTSTRRQPARLAKNSVKAMHQHQQDHDVNNRPSSRAVEPTVPQRRVTRAASKREQATVAATDKVTTRR